MSAAPRRCSVICAESPALCSVGVRQLRASERRPKADLSGLQRVHSDRLDGGQRSSRRRSFARRRRRATRSPARGLRPHLPRVARAQHELAAFVHRDKHVARAQQLRDMIPDLATEGAATGGPRDDVAPDELASYCLHALTVASSLPSKAAAGRLVRVDWRCSAVVASGMRLLPARFVSLVHRAGVASRAAPRRKRRRRSRGSRSPSQNVIQSQSQPSATALRNPGWWSPEPRRR